MTAKQAIHKECCKCNNTKAFYGCASVECKLNDQSKTHVKRIKAFCAHCVPEQSVHGVQQCDGKAGSAGDKECLLHPYRFGKSPAMQAAGRRKVVFTEVVRDRTAFKKETRCIHQTELPDGLYV